MRDTRNCEKTQELKDYLDGPDFSKSRVWAERNHFDPTHKTDPIQ